MDAITSLLRDTEILLPGSDAYIEESRTWAAQKNLSPKLVARPADIETLSKLVAALSKTDLDFAIRCGGVGSVSARDVLVSLACFRDFEFDRSSETIVMGAGQTWGEVDEKMAKEAPGYAGESSPV